MTVVFTLIGFAIGVSLRNKTWNTIVPQVAEGKSVGLGYSAALALISWIFLLIAYGMIKREEMVADATAGIASPSIMPPTGNPYETQGLTFQQQGAYYVTQPQEPYKPI